MREEDFSSYEYFDIETYDDGSRYMHIFGYVWENDGREDDDGGLAPYTVTEYTGCMIPLGDLIACRTSAERWDHICDCEMNVSQYEGDYTWDDLIANGYGDPAGRNGVIACPPQPISFDNYLHYQDIWWNTPDGSYFYYI